MYVAKEYLIAPLRPIMKGENHVVAPVLNTTDADRLSPLYHRTIFSRKALDWAEDAVDTSHEGRHSQIQRKTLHPLGSAVNSGFSGEVVALRLAWQSDTCECLRIFDHRNVGCIQ